MTGRAAARDLEREALSVAVTVRFCALISGCITVRFCLLIYNIQDNILIFVTTNVCHDYYL